MTTKFSKLFFVVALIAATYTFSYAQNQPKQEPAPQAKCSPGQPGCCPKGFMDIPDLTADQKTKLEDLKLKHLKEVTPLKNQLTEKKAKINTLLDAEKTDMAALNAAIDEMTAVTNQLIKKKAEHKLAVRNILTDKQKIMFDAKSDLFDKGCCPGDGHGKGNKEKCGDGDGHGYHHGGHDCPQHK
jgi:Spy/CpxP family protein refolding chaperone